MEAEAVIGTDERYRINAQAHRQPYVRIAKTWSSTSVCTAFKAYNHHTAMTAAHCVHDGPSGGWRTRHQIQFAAGSNRSGGLGLAKNALPSGCYGRVVPGGWVSTGERQYDYAVLYLHGRGGAWCNFADYNVGYYGYKTVTGTGISGYVSGYPDAATSPHPPYGRLERRPEWLTFRNPHRRCDFAVHGHSRRRIIELQYRFARAECDDHLHPNLRGLLI
jgi:V8-like Glu-specific endopeptidase